ncbi:MAG: methyl-accepting chemotaxis sensory transducer [Frankiales bacterium]|nr:methyl-accepting chemotaxis sensory transducer [Frankiales bacterium]
MRLNTIGQRLTAGFAAALLLLVGIGAIAYRNVGAIDDNQKKVTHTYQVLEGLTTILSTLKDAETGQRGYLITGTEDYLSPFTAARQQIVPAIDAVATLTKDNPSQQQRIATLRPLVTSKFAEMQDTITLRRSVGFAAAQRVVLQNKGKAVMDQIRGVVQSMDNAERSLLGTRAKNTESTVSSTRSTVLFGSLFALLLLGVIAWAITRSVTRPVKTLTLRLQEMADGDGDLTQRVDENRRDEFGPLGANFNRFVDKIAGTIRSIMENSTVLSASAQELSAVNDQIAQNAGQASEQAGSAAAAADQVSRNVETVSASSEEMRASIREIARSATEAAEVSQEAVKRAQDTAEIMTKLGESSAEIGDIIKLITSIADQTNLLALNATIEAARAGEAGKGFAVVASEVKDLAQATSRASENISTRVQAVQQETQGAIDAINQITSVVEQVSHHSGVIASAVEEQNATTSEIARNVSEASNGSSDIARNIAGLAETAVQTSSGVGDSQRAADELARMSSVLQELVNQFTV